MTVAELGRRMSAAEMKRWEAYSLVEPFGYELENIIQAQLCCAIVAPHSKETQKLSNWMFDFCTVKYEKSGKEMMASLIGLAGTIGKKE